MSMCCTEQEHEQQSINQFFSYFGHYLIVWKRENQLWKSKKQLILCEFLFSMPIWSAFPDIITWSAAMETSNTPTSPSSTTTISSSSVASNSNTAPRSPSPSSGSIGSRTRGWISSWHSETSIASRGARIGQKMPDLLIDQSPSVVGAKRVWIGGIVNYNINF